MNLIALSRTNCQHLLHIAPRYSKRFLISGQPKIFRGFVLLYDLNNHIYEHTVSVRLVVLQNNYDSAMTEFFVAFFVVVSSRVESFRGPLSVLVLSRSELSRLIAPGELTNQTTIFVEN